MYYKYYICITAHITVEICHHNIYPCQFVFVGMVDMHVCILQERFDPSSKSKLWTMPRKEMCLCQRVVAPWMPSSQSCPRRSGSDATEDLWFTDDYSRVTLLTNGKNWTPAKLDNLLGRSKCCKVWLLVRIAVVLVLLLLFFCCCCCCCCLCSFLLSFFFSFFLSFFLSFLYLLLSSLSCHYSEAQIKIQ